MYKLIILSFIDRETKEVFKLIPKWNNYTYYNKDQSHNYSHWGAMADPRLDIHKVKLCYPAQPFQKGA